MGKHKHIHRHYLLQDNQDPKKAIVACTECNDRMSLDEYRKMDRY